MWRDVFKKWIGLLFLGASLFGKKVYAGPSQGASLLDIEESIIDINKEEENGILVEENFFWKDIVYLILGYTIVSISAILAFIIAMEVGYFILSSGVLGYYDVWFPGCLIGGSEQKGYNLMYLSLFIAFITYIYLMSSMIEEQEHESLEMSAMGYLNIFRTFVVLVFEMVFYTAVLLILAIVVVSLWEWCIHQYYQIGMEDNFVKCKKSYDNSDKNIFFPKQYLRQEPIEMRKTNLTINELRFSEDINPSRIRDILSIQNENDSLCTYCCNNDQKSYIVVHDCSGGVFCTDCARKVCQSIEQSGQYRCGGCRTSFSDDFFAKLNYFTKNVPITRKAKQQIARKRANLTYERSKRLQAEREILKNRLKNNHFSHYDSENDKKRLKKINKELLRMVKSGSEVANQEQKIALVKERKKILARLGEPISREHCIARIKKINWDLYSLFLERPVLKHLKHTKTPCFMFIILVGSQLLGNIMAYLAISCIIFLLEITNLLSGRQVTIRL